MNELFHQQPAETLSPAERRWAIDSLLQRLERVERSCQGGFPLYSPGLTDRWVVSSGGSWLGGFWAGLWWLRARVTGVATDRAKAAAFGPRLAAKLESQSLNRSMIFWYGAAPGALWFGDEQAQRLLEQAAAALARAFDREVGWIPLGTEMGGGADGDRRIAIDTLAPTLRLLAQSPRCDIRELAGQHLQATLAACGTWQGAYCGSSHHEQGRIVRHEPAGQWSRGQAWAMLGLVQAAGLYGEPYLDLARRACDYWLRSRPDPLPANRLERPEEGEDPSAAVIAALAMLGLSSLLGGDGPWREQAECLTAALLRSRHFGSTGVTSGIFGGMCYRTRMGEELVESACSSFFLLKLLLVLDGRVDPLAC
ncbi:glucuronyl hydrolase [Pseudomonas sp. MBLB4123]|uniref:glucuronyl hydrolase n=1 Tax=Pseudomonas sp. MBLB4123 TaxID=3451557 RepID=UPI003F756B93